MIGRHFTNIYTCILPLFLLISCHEADQKNQTTPKYTDITESVYASVRISPKLVYHPQALRSGIIEAIYVHEGDQVKEGEPLFKIKSSAESQGKLRDAELNLQKAKDVYKGKSSQIKNLRAELNTLKNQLELDSVNYIKLQQLWEKNIGSKIELDKAKLKYQSSLNAHKSLSNTLRLTTKNLKTDYDKALNALNADKEALSDYTIYSKIDGQVFRLFKEIGDAISPQEQFGELGTEDYLIELDIDEVDIPKVEISDTAIISLEAYPNKVYKARLDFISTKKDDRTQTFLAEASFLDVPEKLFNGLSGEASIIVSKRNNTMVIPSNFLLGPNTVLTEEGEAKVNVGLRNLSIVEIISGIDTSTILIHPE